MIVDKCLSSINRAQKLKNLNIFIRDTFDLAQKQAELSEKRLKSENGGRSKLDGVLFSLKDNFCTKGINTTCGSKMLENYVPPYDAAIVERLLDAGAILMGKTNMDEFGMGSVSKSYFGTVKNPFNLIRNKNVNDQSSNDFFLAGGSSGGSAASVAAGLVQFSIGSDTGGSVRNPSSISGCIGFKPTYGLISRYGLIPLNNYFDTVGIMSSSMDVLVNVLNVIAGADPRDVTSMSNKFSPIEINNNFKPENITICIPQEFFPNGLSEDNLKAWNLAVDKFAKSGSSVKVVPISLPNTTYTMSCYSVLTSCEVASNFAKFDGIRFGHHSNFDFNAENYTLETCFTRNRDEALGKIVKSRIVTGNYFLLKENYDRYFLKSHQIKQMIVNDFKKAFNEHKVDVIVTPTCFHDTATYEDYLKQELVFDEKDFFTACANIAGLPAISVPAILGQQLKLPVGVQFITNWSTDEFLINIANWFIKNNSQNYPYNSDLFNL